MKKFRTHPYYAEIMKIYERIEGGENGKDIVCYPMDNDLPPVISEKVWIEKDVNGEDIVCIRDDSHLKGTK